MILCISGTGNSWAVASALQSYLGDDTTRLAPGLLNNPSKIKLNVYDGRIVWVFPIHAWAPMKSMRQVIKQISIDSNSPIKHYMVCTCGDDIGYADKLWRDDIRKRGWTPAGAYSVQMPNTYVFLPGFDVDSTEIAAAKVDNMPARVRKIADSIIAEASATDVVRGSWPWTKTRLLRPLFNAFCTSPKRFRTTDACGGCGHCSRLCPQNNIEIINGRPKWGTSCANCLRCYHCCPNHAIRYGKYSEGKGQYYFPVKKISEMAVSLEQQ